MTRTRRLSAVAGFVCCATLLSACIAGEAAIRPIQLRTQRARSKVIVPITQTISLGRSVTVRIVNLCEL